MILSLMGCLLIPTKLLRVQRSLLIRKLLPMLLFSQLVKRIMHEVIVYVQPLTFLNNVRKHGARIA